MVWGKDSEASGEVDVALALTKVLQRLEEAEREALGALEEDLAGQRRTIQGAAEEHWSGPDSLEEAVDGARRRVEGALEGARGQLSEHAGRAAGRVRGSGRARRERAREVMEDHQEQLEEGYEDAEGDLDGRFDELGEDLIARLEGQIGEMVVRATESRDQAHRLSTQGISQVDEAAEGALGRVKEALGQGLERVNRTRDDGQGDLTQSRQSHCTGLLDLHRQGQDHLTAVRGEAGERLTGQSQGSLEALAALEGERKALLDELRPRIEEGLDQLLAQGITDVAILKEHLVSQALSDLDGRVQQMTHGGDIEERLKSSIGGQARSAYRTHRQQRLEQASRHNDEGELV